MTYPRDDRRAPVTALPGYLSHARRILAAAQPAPPRPGGSAAACGTSRTCLDGVDPELDWFELPTACLAALDPPTREAVAPTAG